MASDPFAEPDQAPRQQGKRDDQQKQQHVHEYLVIGDRGKARERRVKAVSEPEGETYGRC